MSAGHTSTPEAPRSGEIKVAVVDDHAIVREGLVDLLLSAGFQVVGQFSTGEEFLAALDRVTCDVLLLDLVLEPRSGPGRLDGLGVLEALHAAKSPIRSVVLTGARNADLLERAYRVGAAAYLHKLDTNRGRLASAVRAVAEGQRWADPDSFEAVWRTTAEQPGQPEDLRLSALTPREREVLSWIGTGADNLKIATALDISERTVCAHVSSLYRKLGRENRAELALLARELGTRAHLS